MLALARQHKTTVFAQAAGAREGAPSSCPGVSASATHGVPQRSWWSHVPCCCCSLSFRMPPRSSKPSTITWEYESDQDGLPVRPHWLLHINLTFPPHLPLKLLCHSLGVQKLPGGAPLTTIFQPLGVVKFTRISRSTKTARPGWPSHLVCPHRKMASPSRMSSRPTTMMNGRLPPLGDVPDRRRRAAAMGVYLPQSRRARTVCTSTHASTCSLAHKTPEFAKVSSSCIGCVFRLQVLGFRVRISLPLRGPGRQHGKVKRERALFVLCAVLVRPCARTIIRLVA